MSLEPMCVKTETEVVCVKEEAECENKQTGVHVKEETRAHVKEETGVHVKEETRAHVKEEIGVHVKEEVQCEESAGLRDLYADHRVKDELVLGPVELHRPCVPSAPPDASYNFQFSRMYVYELWKLAPGYPSEKARHVLHLLLQMVPAENLENENLCNRVTNLCKKLVENWKKVNRTHKYMVNRYSDWLNIIETVNLPKITASSLSRAALDQENSNRNTAKVGRPRKECSKRTQNSRLVELSQDDSAISTLVDTSSNNNLKCEVNVDDVLSLIMEAKLTKHQYLLIKEFVNSKTNPVLPSYHKVMDTKGLSRGNCRDSD